MSDQAPHNTPEGVTEGRPTVGAELAQSLKEAGARRARSRNIGALGRLAPFAARHVSDAVLAPVFLLAATSATLGLSCAVRVLVDHLTGDNGRAATPGSVAP